MSFYLDECCQTVNQTVVCDEISPLKIESFVCDYLANCDGMMLIMLMLI